MEYPIRKTLRLKGYDYSQSGAYFLTICVGGRRAVFSDIRGGEVLLRPAGTIAEAELLRLQTRYGVAIDKYVIMPDHIHVILQIHRQIFRTHEEWHESPQATGRGGALPRPMREEWNEASQGTGAEQSPAPTMGDILCAFKSITTKEINRYYNTRGEKLWQRSYYEHIIRNEREYLNYWQYIEDNPRIWEQNGLYNR